MNRWQLQDAKNKFSNIVDIAMHGNPQWITRRGKDAVVVMGVNDYQKLVKKKLEFHEFLLSGEKCDQLKITRVTGRLREETL